MTEADIISPVNKHLIDINGNVLYTTVETATRLIYEGANLVDISMEYNKGMSVIKKALETPKRQWVGYQSTDSRYYVAAVIPKGKDLTVWYERLVIGGDVIRARKDIIKTIGE